jgi:hypothetical protein
MIKVPACLALALRVARAPVSIPAASLHHQSDLPLRNGMNLCFDPALMFIQMSVTIVLVVRRSSRTITCPQGMPYISPILLISDFLAPRECVANRWPSTDTALFAVTYYNSLPPLVRECLNRDTHSGQVALSSAHFEVPSILFHDVPVPVILSSDSEP